MSERAWWLSLAKSMGMPAGLLGRLMGSREYTEYRALAIIEAAAAMKLSTAPSEYE